MPAEHYRPNGLAQGYYCTTCGAGGVNMVGTGHGVGICEPNPELVAELRKLNSGEPPMKLGEKLKKQLKNSNVPVLMALKHRLRQIWKQFVVPDLILKIGLSM